MDGAFFERRSRVPTPDAGQAGPSLASRCICQFCQSGGKRRWRDSNPQTFLRSPVFGTGCLPVSTHLHIVGRAGFEPASPKATVLQTACLSILHICRCCMSAVRGTRTPSPLSRITGFQDRPGTSCGITAKSTRGGIRTRKSLRTHGPGPCLYNHFHAPGQSVQEKGLEPSKPRF